MIVVAIISDYQYIVVANLSTCAAIAVVIVFWLQVRLIGVVKGRPPVGPSSRSRAVFLFLRALTQLYGLA
jgi:hypothetical protein